MLGSQIKACKPLRNDLKSCQRQRNDLSVWRSVLDYPYKTKNEVKPLTQSAEKWICMGKWAVPSLGILFLRLQKGPRRSDFSGALFAANTVPEKFEHEWTRGRRQKISRIKRCNFCHFFADFRVLGPPSKNSKPITPSMLGVRGSSLDSRKLSPMPFNAMPNQE